MINKNQMYSYSAANTFPMKLILHPDLILSCVKNKKVMPLHLQLNPTNHCNFNCSICSCSARDKNIEMRLEDIRKFLVMFKYAGGKSVTVTGGGEPACHTDFAKVVEVIDWLGLKTGLVANGSLMDKIEPILKKVTWFRISSSDDLPDQLVSLGVSISEWFDRIAEAVHKYPEVDFAFSHVIKKKKSINEKWDDFGHVVKLVRFANDYDFTHVRLVNDIFNADDLAGTMADLREYLIHFAHQDVSRVNFQARSEWTKGANPCYISLLKPVIGADGFLYPCCGTQYALTEPSRDYEKSMRMGFWTDFKDIIDNQMFFDGSVCSKCYYAGYNDLLRVLMEGLNHKEFV